MDKLLASAEVRKRDYLIAQEKKYKKEREQEGEEFAGKEKFVTNAYKRQQEEIRKAEEEEREREGPRTCTELYSQSRKCSQKESRNGIILS